MSRSRLAALISTIVVLTLLVAFGFVTLILALVGDWDEYDLGMTLTLKIMWGTWFTATSATILTRVTAFGWHFRKLRPNEGPRALAMALAAQIKPASWFKAGSTSFAVTVVLVSLFGTAVLASVLIWVIGDWSASRRAMVISLKAVWGTWWVLCIITVLIRVGLFTRERNKAAQANADRERLLQAQAASATDPETPPAESSS